MKNITVETRREIAKAIRSNRETLIECYKATRDGEPADTITALVERIGYTAALETVAELVNGVDAFDGRIYEYVREWAASIETAATGEELENLGIYNPSDIHPAHINQLGQAMRTYTPEEPAKPAGESKGTMTTYEIKPGTVPNAIEIYFNEKPDTATREILKGYRMRWNGKKACWYGFVDADTIADAIKNKTPKATEAPKAAKPKANKYGVKVGDLFRASWGYDQTNNDFFQVIALVGESSVRVREVNPPMIESKAVSWASEDRTFQTSGLDILPPSPFSVFIKDQENGDLKRLKSYQQDGSCPQFYLSSFCDAYYCGGDTIKVYESWYA